MGTRGRELNLYNALGGGETPASPPIIEKEMKQKNSECEKDDECFNEKTYEDEKSHETLLEDFYGDLEGQCETWKSKKWTFPCQAFKHLFFLMLFLFLTSNMLSFIKKKDSLNLPSSDFLAHSSSNMDVIGLSNEPSFEIMVPVKHNKKPLHVEKLFKHTFSNSWGKPLVLEFEPWSKKEKYNFIELELETEIEGTQYDRLLHIFVNDISVWRSSTVEPLNGKKTRSVSVKDITRYINLFKSNEKLEMKFQLDNLVTKKLTGSFDVKLKIKYFNLPEGDQAHESDVSDEKVLLQNALLNHVNPYSSPDTFEPIILNKRVTPLLYFPHTQKQRPYSHPLSAFLKGLDHEKLPSHIGAEFFISGNAAEEFWYSNVIDKFSGKFDKHGHNLLGHGPMRLLNVYLTNVSSINANDPTFGTQKRENLLIHQSIPDPIIFTGGISPALWKPVVSIGAFDLKPIDIDLTPYLEKLLSDTDKEWFLEFEVVSANEDSEFATTVGDNWIVSGNLMAWKSSENEKDVIKYSGNVKHTKTGDFFVETEDDFDLLKQNVTSTAVLVRQHTLTFHDTEYDLTIHHINKLQSNQTYSDFGNQQRIILSTGFDKLYFLKNKEGTVVVQASDIQTWKWIGEIDTIEFSEDDGEVTYDADSILKFSRKVLLEDRGLDKPGKKEKDRDILNISASQVGKSQYTLSPNGNHGHGDSVHSVAVSRSWPWSESYQRHVIVKDNKVIIEVNH